MFKGFDMKGVSGQDPSMTWEFVEPSCTEN